MKKLFITAIAATSILYGAGQAQAQFVENPTFPTGTALVNIDNFETGDQFLDVNGPLPSSGTDTASGSDILGGERDLSLVLTKAATARRGASVSADSPGETSLIFSNKDQSRSVATSAYNNLGGLNWSSGTDFVFDLISSDLGINFSVTVNGVTVSGPLPATQTPTTYSLAFSEFAGVDFSNITSVSFSLTSTVDSADASIDNFGYAEIPEPMTMTGLALGALGLVKFKSSKKQQQA